MATKIKNLTLNDSVYKYGDALNHALRAGQKVYDGSADVELTAEDFDLSSVYTPRGSITVAATAAALSSGKAGDVYNMSDSGVVQNGIGGEPITVAAGDNIVIVEEDDSTDEAVKRWDKLSATIATYTGTGAIVITPGAGASTIGINVGSNIAEVTSGSSTSIEVSLDKAAGVELGDNLDNVTIGDIVRYLGGTVSYDDESNA